MAADSMMQGSVLGGKGEDMIEWTRGGAQRHRGTDGVDVSGITS
jgi:hypothetical protein